VVAMHGCTNQSALASKAGLLFETGSSWDKRCPSARLQLQPDLERYAEGLTAARRGPASLGTT